MDTTTSVKTCKPPLAQQEVGQKEQRREEEEEGEAGKKKGEGEETGEEQGEEGEAREREREEESREKQKSEGRTRKESCPRMVVTAFLASQLWQGEQPRLQQRGPATW